MKILQITELGNQTLIEKGEYAVRKQILMILSTRSLTIGKLIDALRIECIEYKYTNEKIIIRFVQELINLKYIEYKETFTGM